MSRRLLLLALTISLALNAWVSLSGRRAIADFPEWVDLRVRGNYVDTSSHALNANGNTNYVNGYLVTDDGAAHTISAAGGGTFTWNTGGSNTLANAGTDTRIGVQGVGTDGLNDGTFTVYGAITTATTTIADQTIFETDATNGTATLTPGDLVALGHTMVTRGGADQITIDRLQAPQWMSTGLFGSPYGVQNGSRSQSLSPVTIKFDDGHLGYVVSVPLKFNTSTAPTLINFNVDSTPDEYCGIVTFAQNVRLGSFGFQIQSVGTADTFQAIAYSTPSGTPAAIETVTPDPDQWGGDGIFRAVFNPLYDLDAGDEIGVCLRPTSVNNIQWSYLDLTTGKQYLKAIQPFASITMAARTGNAGAFATTQVYHLPDIFVELAGVEEGTGSGGGAFTFGSLFLPRFGFTHAWHR